MCVWCVILFRSNLSKKMNRKTTIFLLILILALGFSLRIYTLDKRDFWSDEAVSLMIAKYATFQNTIDIDYRRVFTEPGLFFLLLKIWMYLTKEESFYRFLPLFFGLFSIALIYLLGKEFCNKTAGLIAALLMSISPLHIYYSQELRNYTLWVFLSLLSIYFFFRILKKEGKAPFLFWFSISTILCLYTHVMALLLLFTVNIYFLFFPGKKKLVFKWIVSNLIVLLFYIPWLFVLINQVSSIRVNTSFFWVPKPDIFVVSHTFNIFNLGFNAPAALYFIGAVVFFPLFLFGARKSLKENALAGLLLFWILVPIGLLILISIPLKQNSIYLYKTLIFVTPAYYILVANGLSGIKKYKFSLLLVFFIVILSGVVLKNYYRDILPLPLEPYRPGIFIKKEFKAAANYVKKEFKAGDIVAHSSRSTIAPFMYYNNNSLEEKWILAEHVDRLFWKEVFSQKATLSKLTVLKPFLAEDIKKMSRDYKRIWLVYSGWDISQRELSSDKKWLNSNFKLLKQGKFKGIDIYLYDTSRKIGITN